MLSIYWFHTQDVQELRRPISMIFRRASCSNCPIFKVTSWQTCNCTACVLLGFEQFGGSRVKNNRFKSLLAFPIALKILRIKSFLFAGKWFCNRLMKYRREYMYGVSGIFGFSTYRWTWTPRPPLDPRSDLPHILYMVPEGDHDNNMASKNIEAEIAKLQGSQRRGIALHIAWTCLKI